MKLDEDLFTATKRLACMLRIASAPLLLVSVIGLVLGIGLASDRGSMGGLIAPLAILFSLLLAAIAHQVAAWNCLRLRRWAMQLGLTLAACWVAVGGAVIGMSILLPGATLLFVIVGGMVVYVAIGGVWVARVSLRRLDEDDGWSTDEPPRPKGFEPVITASTPPSPPAPPPGTGGR